MRTVIITTDQTDCNGDCITHEHTLTKDEADAILFQCNRDFDYLVFTASDGDHAVRKMDVHKVTIE